MRELKFAKLLPGGNTTILVLDRLPRKYQPSIARTIMALHGDCEQVGFLEPPTNSQALFRLQMMGGEFCGNATRSAAWLFMEHHLGHGHPDLHQAKVKLFGEPTPEKFVGAVTKLPLEVSGAKDVILAECFVSRDGVLQDIVVPMPIVHHPRDCFEFDKLAGLDVTIVHLDGISHVVVDADKFEQQGGKPGDSQEAKRILEHFGLTLLPAAGVLFIRQTDEAVAMTPIVYVRDTDTLIPETACGSGTVALAQVIAHTANNLENTVMILQPSGEVITACVCMRDGVFESASIRGQVKVLGEGHILFSDNPPLSQRVEIRRIQKPEDLDRFAEQVGGLYARIFADAPYYERFTPEEGFRYLRETVEHPQGLLFLAMDGQDVVGFGGGLPLTAYPDICEVLGDRVNPARTFYMAELGVDVSYRGEGLSDLLVDARLLRLSPQEFDAVLVRTSVANTATQHLYHDKRGFEIIPEVRQHVVNLKFLPGENEPREVPDTRLFLIRSLS